VELPESLIFVRCDVLEHLVDRPEPRILLALLPVEGAEHAVVLADVRVVDVAVLQVVGDVAVQALAHRVRGPAERVQVRGLEEAEAVLEGEPLARERLLDLRQQVARAEDRRDLNPGGCGGRPHESTAS
jgi:hypothetical protein